MTRKTRPQPLDIYNPQAAGRVSAEIRAGFAQARAKGAVDPVYVGSNSTYHYFEDHCRPAFGRVAIIRPL